MSNRNENPDAVARAGASREEQEHGAYKPKTATALGVGEHDAIAAIAHARAKHPRLCRYGIVPDAQPCDEEFSVDGVITALAYLRQFPKHPTPRWSSYFLKHRAERWGCRRDLDCYVSNGEAIVAASFLGLPIRYGSGPNVAVGISLPRSYVRRAQYGEVD